MQERFARLTRQPRELLSPLIPDFLVYCERLGPGLWAEPVNLVSNVAFVVAGVWALDRCRRRGLGWSRWEIWLLSLLIVAIGAGSALWHSFHTGWAEQLDVLPILVFIHLYLCSFLYRQVGLSMLASAGITLSFFAASKVFAGVTDPGLLNGSVFYLPALIALAFLAGWSRVRQVPAARTMIAALLIFIASLVFRTLDAALCADLPTGTHFVWHLLNALVLGLLVGVLTHSRIVAEAAPTFRGSKPGTT